MTCGGQLRRALGGSYSLHRKRGPRSKSKSTTLTTHSAEELDDTTDAVTTTPPPPIPHDLCGGLRRRAHRDDRPACGCRGDSFSHPKWLYNGSAPGAKLEYSALPLAPMPRHAQEEGRSVVPPPHTHTHTPPNDNHHCRQLLKATSIGAFRRRLRQIRQTVGSGGGCNMHTGGTPTTKTLRAQMRPTAIR